jgi:hypothetical protein
MGIFCPPQPRLRDGTRLDDRIGYRFAALLPPDFAASLPAETPGRYVLGAARSMQELNALVAAV